MTQDLEIHVKKVDREEGLSWARIAGITTAIAVHVAALLLLLAPMAPPATEPVKEDVTFVNLIKPPPPPPPPPPPEEIRPLTPPKTLTPPQPSPLPPPPDEPPILVDDPSPVDVQAPPPSPPSPPAPSTRLDVQGAVDPSSRQMNPPKYPPAEARQGVGGIVMLIISIDGQGNVLDVSIEKSSRNRNLDRAAMDAARKWRFKPAMSGGQGVPSRVRVPVDFIPPT